MKNMLTINITGVIIHMIFQKGLSLRPRINSKLSYNLLQPKIKIILL